MPLNEMITAFWKNLRDDLDGRGVTCNEIPYRYRRLPYKERVKIERDILQQRAREFLDSPHFDTWAQLSGFAPDDLRRRFKNDDNR